MKVKNKFALILPLILIILLFGVSGYWLWMNNNITRIGNEPNSIASPTQNLNENLQNNWKTYSDEYYSFQYPIDWTAEVTTTDYFGHHAIVSNPENTVHLNVLTGRQPFGFAGELKEEINPLFLKIEGESYPTEEHVLDDSKSIYIDYVYNKNGVGYEILIGTGYPAGRNSDYSKDTYLRDKETVLQILSTFEFKQGLITPEPTEPPLSKSYTDPNFGYTISYPEDWVFRKTYGPEIPKVDPNEPIKSGIDLHFPGITNSTANIGLNALEAHGLTNVDEWIAQYDLNFPKLGTRENIDFNGYPAVKFIFVRPENSTKHNEYIYLIKDAMVYRIMYWEMDGISETTRSIVNSFSP